MMGSGKTTVGKLVANRLKLTLVDTDHMIETREGCSIPELFAAQGEGYFRSLEVGVATALSLRTDLVVACGGGLPLRDGAISPLKESGVVFWLDRDPADIYDCEDMTGRPLAQDGRDAFLKKAAERRTVYGRWADYTITDFTSAVSTAARILEVLK